MPMSQKARPIDYSPLESEAIFKSINKYTYCLVIGSGPGNGTAIPFKVNDRLFLLTAGHVLDPKQNGNDTCYQFVRKDNHSTLKLTNPTIYFDAQKDIGIVELTNLDDVSNVEFLDPKNILFISNDRNYNILVSGFPNEFIFKPSYDLAFPAAHSMSLKSVRRSDWKDLPAEEPYAEWDILCEHGHALCSLVMSDEVGFSKGKCQSPEKLGGISGGGMWASLMADTPQGLRIPYPCLIGLQKRALEGERIRGVLVKHVMDFLTSKYPELHDDIYNKISQIELNTIVG